MNVSGASGPAGSHLVQEHVAFSPVVTRAGLTNLAEASPPHFELSAFVASCIYPWIITRVAAPHKVRGRPHQHAPPPICHRCRMVETAADSASCVQGRPQLAASRKTLPCRSSSPCVHVCILRTYDGPSVTVAPHGRFAKVKPGRPCTARPPSEPAPLWLLRRSRELGAEEEAPRARVSR